MHVFYQPSARSIQRVRMRDDGLASSAGAHSTIVISKAKKKGGANDTSTGRLLKVNSSFSIAPSFYDAVEDFACGYSGRNMFLSEVFPPNK